MTIHSLSSGDADLSRTRVSVFALPTRTFSGGLNPTWMSYVGTDARRKAASMRSESTALSYLTTQALMYALAAQRLGIPARDAHTITVDRSCQLCASNKPHGKPRIEGVNFNMSQVSSLVIGGFCEDERVPLGVDVEAVQGSLFPGFARVALTDTERAAHEALPPDQRQAAGVALWTAKEAVLKATGHGLSVSPRAVQIDCDEDTLALISALCEPVPAPDAPARRAHAAEHELSVSPRMSVRATLTLPGRSSPEGSPKNGAAAASAGSGPADQNLGNQERSFVITWAALTLSSGNAGAHPAAGQGSAAGSDTGKEPKRASSPQESCEKTERFLLAAATEDTVPVVDVHSVATPLDIKHSWQKAAAGS